MKLILALLIFVAPFVTSAQSGTEDKKAAKLAAIKNMVESQNYVFKAQTVMPMSGPIRQLTTDYDVKITKQSVISFLPYFGRAYSAPMDPSKGGIQFTSKDFDYSLTPGKKDGWSVLIKPKDYRDVQQMTLTISSTGYAIAQVTSTSRQPISFNGTIVAPKTK
ncbi:MAG TPA: DUF4251 domain-containing protein [Puia sp.]|nr:DUF4251 domain-containing protein [Puia sp.]